MNRLMTLVGTAVVAGAVWAAPAEAQPGAAAGPEDRAPRVATAMPSGLIEGAVVDERGWPLAGVTVSALGSTTALAVTDRSGAFRLAALPAGGYLVRAHLAGFAPSRREFVQVGPGRPARFSVTLRRAADAPAPPPLLAASLGLTGAGAAESGATDADASEKTWRLRHLERSILKQTTERAAVADEQPADGHSPTTVTRAAQDSNQFFAGLPLTAEVNFLTSGSIDGADAGVSDSSTQRTAYVSLGGPAFHGDWSGQVMTQGNLGSWFVAGKYRKRAPASHLFDVTVSYSALRFPSAAHWSLAPAESDNRRSSGTVDASDTWSISPRITLSYGARYARYDYLPTGLFSPGVNLIIQPVEGLRVMGSASRRLLAPGAEQFLAPLGSALWLPPEQAFVGESMVAPEATNNYELGLEQELWPDVIIAVRAFVQQTRHQQTVLFGDLGLGPEAAGRYAVADSGNLDARGWSIGISGSPWAGARGSVLYSMTDASWLPGLDGEGYLLVGLAPRTGHERLHDLTTSFEAEIAPTATTLIVAYRVNSGFARPSADGLESGLDGRFDLQVVQRLPFLDFTSARWQALVAVRNTFRDAQADSSVYDELLVLRPPKRVVGGLLVRF